MHKRIALGTLALVATIAAPAVADPINIVAGSIYYQRQDLAAFSGSDGTSGPGGWYIRSDFGLDESWWPSQIGPTTPGTQVDLSQSESFDNDQPGNWWESPFAGGAFLSGGTWYWIDSLSFTIRALDTVTAPATDNTPNDGFVTYSENWARFVFEGAVTGTSEGGAVAQAMLTGAGRARLATLDNGWFASIYRFEDPAPVPEPGTLLLFATGAAAVIRRRLTGAG